MYEQCESLWVTSVVVKQHRNMLPEWASVFLQLFRAQQAPMRVHLGASLFSDTREIDDVWGDSEKTMCHSDGTGLICRKALNQLLPRLPFSPTDPIRVGTVAELQRNVSGRFCLLFLLPGSSVLIYMLTTRVFFSASSSLMYLSSKLGLGVQKER